MRGAEGDVHTRAQRPSNMDSLGLAPMYRAYTLLHLQTLTHRVGTPAAVGRGANAVAAGRLRIAQSHLRRLRARCAARIGEGNAR